MSDGKGARGTLIVRTSVIGILANIFFVAVKAAVGIASNSIAIVLDAVNNLSDALSSVITIIGTKLAGRAPDKEHPLGHGRIEYMSAALIAAIVIYAGITSLVESVKKLIEPVEAIYSISTVAVIVVAVIVKIVLGSYFRSIGSKVNSDSLTASGTDALFDAAISTSTLLAAAAKLAYGWSLEAPLGVVISIIIIKSGLDMLSDTIDELLGKRIDAELSRRIKEIVRCASPEVLGAYDLLLHSYGPDQYLGSVHIEVPDDTDAHRIDEITRIIQRRVYERTHVIMATVGIYSVNTDKGNQDDCAKMRFAIRDLVMSHDYVLQVHGLFIDYEDRRVTLDMIVSFSAPDRQAVYDHIRDELSRLYPDFEFQITLDSDISD